MVNAVLRLTEADVRTLDSMVGEWEADGLNDSARKLVDRIKAAVLPSSPPPVPETCVTCHEFPSSICNICLACDCDEHGEVKEAEQTRVKMRAKAAAKLAEAEAS